MEQVTGHDQQVMTYLGRNLVRNALDIWSLKKEVDRYSLHVCKVDGRAKAHLGIYRADDAMYAGLGGAPEAAETLVDLIPRKAVITVPPTLGKLVTSRIRPDKVFPHYIMTVDHGQERLVDSGDVKRLTVHDAVQYSQFGSSFNAPRARMKWVRERLEKSFVFGAFLDGTLVSIASLVAWLPRVAVIMGVETKEEFRRMGFGTSVVSAAVGEGMKRSKSCTLFVRSANHGAIRLYRKLGFGKFGDELWVDRGTGIVP